MQEFSSSHFMKVPSKIPWFIYSEHKRVDKSRGAGLSYYVFLLVFQ